MKTRKQLIINGVIGQYVSVKTPKDRVETCFDAQTWVSEPRKINGYGHNAEITVTIRYDDQRKNKHNIFSITAEIKCQGARDLKACGCLHEDITQIFPELAPLVKWHLMRSDGLHCYIANTVYHAGNRDCNGLQKGEKQQLVDRSGLPMWELVCEAPEYIKFATQPSPVTVSYQPWYRVGEGKTRDFNAARSSAIWPDASDEQLSAPPEELEAVLMARWPALISDFRAAIEGIGFLFEPLSNHQGGTPCNS